MRTGIKQFVTSHRAVIFDLAMILLLGLLPLTWFKGNLLISHRDFSFPPALRNFRHLFYIWDSSSLGVANSQKFAHIPCMAFMAFLSIIGIPLVVIEKIYFVVLFTSSGLSMYYLTSTLIEGKKKRIAALTSAFFYMVNPFTMNVLWHCLLLLPFHLYAFIPLVLALYIKGLREKRILLYPFLICFISILTSSAGTNPVFTIVVIPLLFSYLIFYILENRKRKIDITHALKFTAFLTILLLGINMWWLLPQIASLGKRFAGATGALKTIGLSNLAILELNSRMTSLLNVFRLQGFWEFYDGYKGDPYYTYASLYSLGTYQCMGFLIPILAFINLLKKRDGKVLYFACLTIFGLFLIKGTQPPLGIIYIWLFKNIPLFGIFRNFYDKFGVMVTLGYAFLIGVGVGEIYHYIGYPPRPSFKNDVRKVTAIIFVIFIFLSIFGVYARPMWTGEVIPKGGKVIPSAHIKIPHYYYTAGTWLDGQSEDFRIFPLPFPTLFYAAYDWDHGYWGSNPCPQLFPKPIMSYTGSSYNLPISIARQLHENSSKDIAKVLALLNVKYILLHRDTNWEFVKDNVFWISTSSKHYKTILNSQNGIHLEKTFGKLDFYRNEFFKPLHIYATSKVCLIEGGLKEMIKEAEGEDFRVGESVLLLSKQLSPKQHSFIKRLNVTDPKGRMEVNFKQINSTKYIIQAKVSKPFFLILSESFDPGWKAYIDGKEQRQHFLVNSYANGWYIDRPGKCNISIEYVPQRLFISGGIISLITLFIFVIYPASKILLQREKLNF